MTKLNNSVQKGKELENYIAKKIRDSGLDPKAERSIGSGSGTREKADISTSVQLFGRNLGIEAKNHKTLHIPEWWKQVEKLELLGREPVLIYRAPNRNPSVYLTTIYLDTFIEMLVALQGKESIENNLVSNSDYDKTKHLNSLLFLKNTLGNAINDYKKKIINDI